MEMSKLNLSILFLIQLAVVAYGQGLSPYFYQKSCPNLEKIVRQTMRDFINRAPSLAGPLLRMHFHDCFVRVSFNLIYLCFSSIRLCSQLIKTSNF